MEENELTVTEAAEETAETASEETAAAEETAEETPAAEETDVENEKPIDWFGESAEILETVRAMGRGAVERSLPAVKK